MTEDPVQTAKSGIALVGEIIKAAGDNPNVKAAGENIGQTALTITNTINNALLPLAAINFAFDKARQYFSNRFQQDLAAKAAAIPIAEIIEPKASIAGPALQGLAFTHEEVNLREMYLSLLATSMDARISSEAHPAFVEIIKQLTAEEAALLQYVIRGSGQTPIVEVRVSKAGQQGWRVLQPHLLNLVNLQTSEPIESPRGAAMVANWVRLGLAEVDYGKQLMDTNAYAWVENRPEYTRLKAQHARENNNVTFQRGVLGRTALGLQFGRAVGLLLQST